MDPLSGLEVGEVAHQVVERVEVAMEAPLDKRIEACRQAILSFRMYLVTYQNVFLPEIGPSLEASVATPEFLKERMQVIERLLISFEEILAAEEGRLDRSAFDITTELLNFLTRTCIALDAASKPSLQGFLLKNQLEILIKALNMIWELERNSEEKMQSSRRLAECVLIFNFVSNELIQPEHITAPKGSKAPLDDVFFQKLARALTFLDEYHQYQDVLGTHLSTNTQVQLEDAASYLRSFLEADRALVAGMQRTIVYQNIVSLRNACDVFMHDYRTMVAQRYLPEVSL